MAWGEGERGAGPAQRCQYVEVSVAEARPRRTAAAGTLSPREEIQLAAYVDGCQVFENH